MERTKWLGGALACACAAMAGPAAMAADAASGKTHTLVLDGVVTAVNWSGPKLVVGFRSNDGYDTAMWKLAGPEVATLQRMGWDRNSLKAGDRVDAVVNPSAADDLSGEVLRFIFNDGATLETSIHGSTEVIPRYWLNYKFDKPQDDPMWGFYGNTQVISASDEKGPPEANYNGHTWYNADHTMMVASNDMKADRTWGSHVMTGIWWLEKQHGDRWTRCMLFTPSLKPNCHSPVGYEKVGDKWQAILRGPKSDWVEHRELVSGQH